MFVPQNSSLSQGTVTGRTITTISDRSVYAYVLTIEGDDREYLVTVPVTYKPMLQDGRVEVDLVSNLIRQPVDGLNHIFRFATITLKTDYVFLPIVGR